MKERIERRISLDNMVDISKEASVSHQPGDNSHHSTTECNLPEDQLPGGGKESEVEGGVMDRADVLFKYILRSFRKHYCKSF